MKNYTKFIVSTSLAALLLCIALDARAQQTFLLKNASKTFDVKIQIAKCEEDVCEGKAAIEISEKAASSPLQIISMPNLYLELGKEDRKPTANLIELYGENNSGVIFDDFNFDGAEDLALRNGNEGSYGGPSYDVFFATPGKKFVKNAALTKLASENLGLFKVDAVKKTLETFNKSGCCWHQTIRYKVVNNRPVKIYVFTEDAASGGDKVTLTTETLVAGKWKKSVKTALTKDYYKNP